MPDGLLLFFLFICAVFDLATRKVPNLLIAATALMGLVSTLLPNEELNIGFAVMGFFLGLVLFLPPFLMGAMGAADVKVFAVAGMYLGPTEIFHAFIYTLLSGGVLALLYWIIAKIKDHPIGGWRIFDSNTPESNGSQQRELSHITLPYIVAIFWGVLITNLLPNWHR